MLLVSASHLGFSSTVQRNEIEESAFDKHHPDFTQPFVQHFLMLLKRQKTSATTIPAIVLPCCLILYLRPGILLDISLELQL